MTDIKKHADVHSRIALLAQENYSIGLIRSISCLTGGYGSHTYFIRSETGDYVFRDIEQNGMNHPENEALITAELKSCYIPVPEIIPAKIGSYLVISEGKTYQLRSFVEGILYGRSAAPEWLLVDSARMLGRLQRCMAKLPPLPEGLSSGYFEYFTPERAEQSHRKTLETADALRDTDISDAIQCKLEMIRSLRKPEFDFSRLTCRNTHGDYKIQNIVCGRREISAVIDFTGACTHPLCFEVIRSYTLADPECADGRIHLENFKKYIACFLEQGTLNAYDLKLMPSIYFYQNVVADYFGQYYAMESENKKTLLEDAFFALMQCKWLEQNMTTVENALVRSF